ncbi:hypothetical protein PR202_ga22736 [Eleusine coracana subsp. coracana]|uniref:Pentatricopeptide repeat-containing protein n=1 Tax=Eleusine coracana subsp. coracana TaxID=191504 RepID=A0AAV5D3Z9_ELECO|nr:hypothetical protein PR202_ga22736 [Eleusine coracana subsp. coracana]
MSFAHPLASHPHPAVAAFPHAGFSHLADHPLLARAVHGFVLRRALPLSAFHRNTLLSFYFRRQPGRGGASAAAALHLFDEMPHRTDSSWYTAISAAYAAAKTPRPSISCRTCGRAAYRSAGSRLPASSRRGSGTRQRGREEGATIHTLTHRAGLMGNVYIGTALLHMYGSRGLVQDAWRLFWEMPEGKVVSWTALMVALSSNGYCENVLQGKGLHATPTHSPQWSCVMSLRMRRRASRLLPCRGLWSPVACFGAGKLDDAKLLFCNMSTRDIISWNTMISAYMQNDNCIDAMNTANKLL